MNDEVTRVEAAPEPEPERQPDVETDTGVTSQVAQATPARPQKAVRSRGAVAWILVVIASLLMPIAIVAFWGQRTLTDSERFLETVGPLAESQVIKDYVVEKTTDTLMATIKQNNVVADALSGLPPAVTTHLVAPIEGAIESLVNQVVSKVVNSPKFNDFWIEINKEFQKALIGALSGDTSGPVSVSGDEVVLDTGVVAEAAKAKLVERGLTMLQDKPIPPELNQKVVILRSQELEQARIIYAFSIPIARYLIPALAIIVLAGVAISARRARLVSGIGIGIALAAVALSIGLGAGKEALGAAAPDSAVQSVLDVFWITLTSYLATAVSAWLTAGIIVALLGWFGGRSAPATSIRSAVSASLRGAGSKAAGSWSAAPSQFAEKYWRIGFVIIAALGVLVVFLSEQASTGLVLGATAVCLLGCAGVTALRGAVPPPAS